MELHCAEECSHLFQNIILLSREQSLTSDFTVFVKIEQSATGHAILLMKFSPLS